MTLRKLSRFFSIPLALVLGMQNLVARGTV